MSFFNQVQYRQFSKKFFFFFQELLKGLLYFLKTRYSESGLWSGKWVGIAFIAK